MKTVLSKTVLIVLLAASAAVATASSGEFSWRRANAAMASAVTPADYTAAAELYAGMIKHGIVNAHVFRNYGTALLLAGANDAAADAFRRAEICGGTSSDLLHNLRLAASNQAAASGGTSSGTLSWTRAPLFWHYKFPLRERFMIAVFCFNLIFAAFALRRIKLKSLARGLFAAGIAGLILFGSSALVSVRHLSAPLPPVVSSIPLD